MFKKFLITTTTTDTDTATITTNTITAFRFCLARLFFFWKLLRVRPCSTKENLCRVLEQSYFYTADDLPVKTHP